jgi:hypothetical protein
MPGPSVIAMKMNGVLYTVRVCDRRTSNVCFCFPYSSTETAGGGEWNARMGGSRDSAGC